MAFAGTPQRDPLNEYKNESFQLFEGMLDSLRQEVTQKLGQVQPMTEEERNAMIAELQAQQAAMAQAATAEAPVQPKVAKGKPLPGFIEDDPSTWGNPGRNDLCPCGSGKKFKHCHGRLA